METRIDHLVIAAATLEQGITYVKELFGVAIPFGGVHEKMGTHNHLMHLGDELFLEVISINPDIPAPNRPRWFGLDDPIIRQQLKKNPIFLTWVVNTTHLESLLRQSAIPLGEVEKLSRNNLHWKFALPEDGRLLASGMLPYIIEWETDIHPAAQMTDCQCRLVKLAIYHPCSNWLHSILHSIDAENLVTLYSLPPNTTPYLKATIKTPTGLKQLISNIE